MNALISISPVILLFVLMLGFKVKSHLSALVTLAVTVMLAIWIAPATGILPDAAASHAGGTIGFALIEGVLKAFFPILIIILMAIFSYNVLVESGQIEVIKAQFSSFTDDKGILVLMMVWGFGGLLEGMAGFGTAVAIPAAILIGLGFKPMFSALVALLGNTVTTGFGAVGVPVTTLCNEVTAGGTASVETIREISSFVIVQLSPLFFIIPFIILTLTDRKAIGRNIILSLWTGGISLSVQYACARWLGAETPAILGSIAAIVVIVAYARLSGPKKRTEADGMTRRYTAAETLRAWSVYIFILTLILVTGALCPPIEKILKSNLVTSVSLPCLGSTFRFGWLSNAGLWLFAGSVAGGLVQGLGWRKLLGVLARTMVNLRFTTVTIVSLIALASVMNHSGMISASAVGLTAISGSFYPFFAPLIGAIGTFVTGSDTSSNILFGKLQASMAGQSGMNGYTTVPGVTGSESNWLAASNTTGATGGKMISPQSIAIATGACDMEGKDDAILRKAIPYALLYIIIAGAIVLLGS